MLIIFIIFQVCADLGIADHVWQDKCAAIAQNNDALGDQFRPAVRAGWQKYICNTYPDSRAVLARPAVGAGTSMVAD
jgi:hypothetical protein